MVQTIILVENAGLIIYSDRMDSDTPTKAFGEAIRKARVAAKKYKTLGLAAASLSLSRSQLQAWETGKIVDPNADVIRDMARLYGVTDELELFRPLIQSKYNLDLDDLQTFETDLGRFYRRPERVVAEILQKKDDFRHAWFKLLSSDAHANDVYYDAIVELLQEQIEIRMWIHSGKDDRLRERLYNDKRVTKKVVDHYLRYETDSNVIQRVFDTSSGADDGANEQSDESSHPFNETYFFGSKPKAVKEGDDDFRTFWTGTGEQGKGTLLKPKPHIAFKYFKRLRDKAW